MDNDKLKSDYQIKEINGKESDIRKQAIQFTYSPNVKHQWNKAKLQTKQYLNKPQSSNSSKRQVLNSQRESYFTQRKNLNKIESSAKPETPKVSSSQGKNHLKEFYQTFQCLLDNHRL